MTGAAADWPLYQGTKQLRARPCNKAAYCQIRGWIVPADEDPDEAGYLVEYAEGGKPNVDGFDGYISWSPADVFERSYKRWETHTDRMAVELSELSDRVNKLAAFVSGSGGVFDGLPDDDQALLRAQLSAMHTYETVLRLRLNRVPIRPV